MSPLKLYYDLMSQPSRALKLFLTVNKVPFQDCPVSLATGEHKREPFLSVNKFGRAPAIDDDGFKMSESVAIVHYVAKKYNINNNWYPSDLHKQARVIEFLEWHHLDLRLGCAMYFRTKFLIPLATGKPAVEATVERYRKSMIASLANVEKLWLGDGRKFLTGDEISVADIFAACEIEQIRLGGDNPAEGRPKLGEWLERVRKELHPHYADAHKVINSLVGSVSSNL